MPQKEETFQVVIDIIKNSTCFKAFTISADVPEIFMQQFWYTIKKASDTDSYEFLLANKKCTVNVEVFRTILDICLRIEGVDFADVPDDDTALTFLIDLCYKVWKTRRGVEWWMRSSEEEFNQIDILTSSKKLFLGKDATWAIPNMGFNLVDVEGVWLSLLGDRGVSGFGMGEAVLSTFEELQMLGFFLQMGFTIILATLDGLDVGFLGDVIGEDDCDEDE
ncbi:hypothetical protein Tco_0624959 [Tanacetum coccineum]|uniref:Uncharacterized protein n=1 Tax=Tanacetum coccineum TaxID=301880 RepID=A0ABQ4WFH4_9ASTR